jgi:5-methyltetrahydrofolate--homocysteine methyltransferase
VGPELGIDASDASDRTALITKQSYQGERYSFGYPACPDVEQQAVIVDLLDPQRIGVELSEEFQLHPEQSTSALIVHHPAASYYNAG